MRRIAILAAIMIAACYSSYLPAAVTDAKLNQVEPSLRVEPEFPRAALRAGAERGLVTARMTLDAEGKVTQVDIVQSEPRRLFDLAVTQALAQWRYPEGRSGRVVEVEVGFRQK